MKLRCFTLVELLLVLAIIILLAGLLFPSYQQARERAREAQCFSSLHQIGVGMQVYADDYDGRFPIGAYNSQSPQPTREWDLSWHDLILPYLGDRKGVLVCPDARDVSYRYSYGVNPWLSGYYCSLPETALTHGARLWVGDHATFDWPLLPRDYPYSLPPGQTLEGYLSDRHRGFVQAVFSDGHAAALKTDRLGMGGGLWQP